MFYLCDVIVDQFNCLIFLIQRSHHEQLSLEELQKPKQILCNWQMYYIFIYKVTDVSL